MKIGIIICDRHKSCAGGSAFGPRGNGKAVFPTTPKRSLSRSSASPPAAGVQEATSNTRRRRW
jgi:hypothetical protein